ncbi:MAG: sigma-70 family RNA polymerase sigma factor [Planctomycetes bacterium]|nr:sigma-70 family RNA polymerase sigma factor [Planctomycetota bacterium]
MSDWTPDIERLRRFDDQEWLAVERNYAGRLMAYVHKRVPDRTAREDVVQETFLGAVRGIGDFDPVFTFEQYLFGICKNRTIDWLRRQRAIVIQPRGEHEDVPILESLFQDDETPSGIVRQDDLRRAGEELLIGILRDWVQETWREGEFTRLMVIEALFSAEWRNRDTWERFGLRDETAVAGIKFRALKRLRELAVARDPRRNLLPLLAVALADEEDRPAIRVPVAWKKGRVSCPARHWVARHVAGALDGGPGEYVRFHLDELCCEWCQANADDLRRLEEEAELEPLLERMGQSTLQLLRSRTSK